MGGSWRFSNGWEVGRHPWMDCWKTLLMEDWKALSMGDLLTPLMGEVLLLVAFAAIVIYHLMFEGCCVDVFLDGKWLTSALKTIAIIF